jgi:hypothetical protein
MDPKLDGKALAASTVFSRCSKMNPFLICDVGRSFKELAPQAYQHIKKEKKGHTPKKASVFTLEQLQLFWTGAENSGVWLQKKLVSFLGYYGALRTSSELMSITWESFEKTAINDGYWVHFTPAKSHEEKANSITKISFTGSCF